MLLLLQMATTTRKTLWAILIFFTFFTDSFMSIQSVGVGINYGQIANNLPQPSRVAYLLRSLNISRVRLYDADPNVLSAFANSEVEFVIGLGNENLQQMTDPNQARNWIQQRVQPYISQTRIRCIAVGNEVLGDTRIQQLAPYLLPAMQNIHSALVSLGLDRQVNVTTAHSFKILANSFPPSAGAFSPEYNQYLQGILDFHAQTNSPFLINAYPFFAYMGDPGQVSLNYALFQPNPGMVDPATNLHYDNMLYAQIDSVYSAIRALGHTDVQVKVSETGWPSRGDPDEVGATPENARLYNSNLLRRIQQNQGTPARPSVPVDIFVFALFNENMKTGPSSERNYGLLYPDGSPVYNIELQSYQPRMDYSGSKKNVVYLFNLFVLPLALLLCSW